MSPQSPSPDGALSRRLLLCGASLFAASAVAPGLALAASKVPQGQAGYKAHASGAARCGKCSQFLPPAGCKVVDGIIDPSGYCNFFAPRPP